MEPFVFHQALYGYRDGHRLLASSRTLPIDAARALLILSDRSGPSLHPEFDGYLTATSLPDCPVYALCRTYDAPELSRTGCVYTHVLLIDWTDLSRLQDLRWLARVHRRPSVQPDDPFYCEPLRVVPEPVQASKWNRAAAERLLTELYASPEHALVLPADHGAQWESLVLAVWSQMWPRLRRHFRFSTGSMSLRGQARREFDLHIVPRASAQRMKGDMQGTLLDLDSPPQKDQGNWLELAIEDLAFDERTPLRSFLVQHTVDIEPQRSLFPLMIDAYSFASGQLDSEQKTRLVKIVETVGCAFPRAAQACRLKQTLLGASEPSSALQESKRLFALGLTRHATAFEPETLRLSERTEELFHSDRLLALELLSDLLAESDLNSLGQRMLEVCARQITPLEIGLLEKKRIGSVRALLPYNISLASLPEAWQSSNEEQLNLIREIANYRYNLNSNLLSQIARTIVLNANSKFAEAAIGHLGQVIGDAAVLVLSTRELDSKQWLSSLEKNPQLLIDWLTRNHHADYRQIALVMKLIPPLEPFACALPVDYWLDLLSHANRSAISKKYVSSFLLSLGLQNIHEQGNRLCVPTFADVWYLVDNQDLPSESWRQLQSVLPADDLLDVKWKRKERLAKALVGSFVRYHWPREHFLLTLSSPGLLENIADAVSSRWNPSPFLKSIAMEVDANRLLATEEQWRVIKKWK